MEFAERIVVNPDVCNGKPVIKGTRITVQSILEYLSAGDSHEDVLQQFPDLKKDDIKAALQFAAQLLGHSFTVKRVA